MPAITALPGLGRGNSANADRSYVTAPVPLAREQSPPSRSKQEAGTGSSGSP